MCYTSYTGTCTWYLQIQIHVCMYVVMYVCSICVCSTRQLIRQCQMPPLPLPPAPTAPKNQSKNSTCSRDAHQDLAKIGDLDSSSDRIK